MSFTPVVATLIGFIVLLGGLSGTFLVHRLALGLAGRAKAPHL